MSSPWYSRIDELTPEEMAAVLEDLENTKLFPRQYREIQQRVKAILDEAVSDAKLADPFAFVQASYEQAIKLNAWWAGITWPIDFDANRIGKTACTIFNALLWILPYNPDAKIYIPYDDHLDRPVRVLPRPSIQTVLDIQSFFHERQHLQPNLDEPYYSEHNLPIWNQIPDHLKLPTRVGSPPVEPPRYQTQANTVWHGAPTLDFIKSIILKEWIKWTPPNLIVKNSEYDHIIKLEIPIKGRKTPIKWDINFKTYESADTVWAGAAVDAIILSEGPTQDVLNEVKQRFKDSAFAAWDYTPYENSNTGPKTAIAHRVFLGREKLPLRTHVYSGFGIENTPEYIMSKRKREDLLRVWENSPEGKARIHGQFFTSTPKALPKLDERTHAIENYTLADLQRRWPYRLRYFRGLDPGWGHLCSCTWAALTPRNEWFIYRGYTSTGRSVDERVKDIVELSGNYLTRIPSSSPIPTYREIQSSETYDITYMDHHSWKVDETLKIPFAIHYIRAGLVVTKSIGYGPRERAKAFNNKLTPSAVLSHPTRPDERGSRVYFLVDEPGVREIYAELDALYFKTYQHGERKGLTQEELQDYNDDRFDSTSYLVCSPIVHNEKRMDPDETLEESLDLYANAFNSAYR